MKGKQPLKPATVSVGNATVKIYCRKRRTALGKSRTIFEVADKTGGKRKLRGFTDRAKAVKEAKRIADQLASGHTTAASMHNNEAASYGRAIELLRPTGASLEEAAVIYAKAREILGADNIIEAARFYSLHRADKIEHRTVAQTVAELIAAKEARGKSARYIADLRARLNKFANKFSVDISTVTGPDVQGWLNGLKLAPRTAKNFQSCVHTLFSFAESNGYVLKGANPVSDTEEISTANESAIEIYTPAEILTMLNAAPSEFAPVIAIGAFAGMRTAEIERLDWHDIDLIGGFIHVAAEKAKTRSRRLVPVLPNLARWLAPLVKQQGRVWKGTSNTINAARAETAKAAGIPWKSNALRHSFISYRLADIQNAAQVALEAGNSPAMIFRHYREIVKPDAAKAWFAIAPDMPQNVTAIYEIREQVI